MLFLCTDTDRTLTKTNTDGSELINSQLLFNEVRTKRMKKLLCLSKINMEMPYFATKPVNGGMECVSPA